MVNAGRVRRHCRGRGVVGVIATLVTIVVAALVFMRGMKGQADAAAAADRYETFIDQVNDARYDDNGRPQLVEIQLPARTGKGHVAEIERYAYECVKREVDIENEYVIAITQLGAYDELTAPETMGDRRLRREVFALFEPWRDAAISRQSKHDANTDVSRRELKSGDAFNRADSLDRAMLLAAFNANWKRGSKIVALELDVIDGIESIVQFFDAEVDRANWTLDTKSGGFMFLRRVDADRYRMLSDALADLAQQQMKLLEEKIAGGSPRSES